jgi:RNA recognition motif-containing protein
MTLLTCSSVRPLFPFYLMSRTQHVDTVRDPRSGTPTGAGFLQFKSTEIAADAIGALDGRILSGHSKFEISYAKPRADNGNRRGFGTRNNRGSSRDSDNRNNNQWDDERQPRMRAGRR